MSGDGHTAWCERKHDAAAECFATIGGSGHVEIALTLDEYGDVLIRVEQVDTGEVIDMDAATCGEIVPLLHRHSEGEAGADVDRHRQRTGSCAVSRPRVDLRPEYSAHALAADVIDILAGHGITVELDPALAYVCGLAAADLLRALQIRPASVPQRRTGV